MKKINIPAVVVAGVVYWLVQAGWYTVLGKQWVAALGTTEEQLQKAVGGSPMPYIIALVANIVTAYALAWVLAQAGKTTAVGGLQTGLLMSVGFLATSTAIGCAFQGHTLKLYAIDVGCMLLGFAVMGAIIGAWKKKAGGDVAKSMAA